MNHGADAVTQKAAAISSIASKTTWFGAGGTIFAGITLHELGILAGIVIALSGFVVNWVYKHKALKLKRLGMTRITRMILTLFKEIK